MLVEFAQLVAAAAPAEAMDVSHWSLLDIRSQSADEMGGVSDEVRKQLSSLACSRQRSSACMSRRERRCAVCVGWRGCLRGERDQRGGREDGKECACKCAPSVRASTKLHNKRFDLTCDARGRRPHSAALPVSGMGALHGGG